MDKREKGKYGPRLNSTEGGGDSLEGECGVFMGVDETKHRSGRQQGGGGESGRNRKRLRGSARRGGGPVEEEFWQSGVGVEEDAVVDEQVEFVAEAKSLTDRVNSAKRFLKARDRLRTYCRTGTGPTGADVSESMRLSCKEL